MQGCNLCAGVQPVCRGAAPAKRRMACVLAGRGNPAQAVVQWYTSLRSCSSHTPAARLLAPLKALSRHPLSATCSPDTQFMHWKLGQAGEKYCLHPDTMRLTAETAHTRPPDPTYGERAVAAECEHCSWC